MNNTKQIMENHKKRILHSSYSSYTKYNKNSKTNKTCNCRQKNNCPLNGNFLQSSVAYQATVTRNDNNTSKTYIGHTETDFKTRHRKHTTSVRHAKHKNLANTSGHSRSTTLTILFHGASYHLVLPTTAPVKDATSA